MSREERTREERLAEMLASADALAAEWKAQAEAYRLELEVERDKLAAAERAMRMSNRTCDNVIRARDSAEARVRELKAHLVASDGARTRAEQQLAAANALLKRSIPVMSDRVLREVVAHLSAQPAALPCVIVRKR